MFSLLTLFSFFMINNDAPSEERRDENQREISITENMTSIPASTTSAASSSTSTSAFLMPTTNTTSTVSSSMSTLPSATTTSVSALPVLSLAASTLSTPITTSLVSTTTSTVFSPPTTSSTTSTSSVVASSITSSTTSSIASSSTLTPSMSTTSILALPSTSIEAIPSGICTRLSKSGAYKNVSVQAGTTLQTEKRRSKQAKTYCRVVPSEGNWLATVTAICSDKPGYFQMDFPGYYSNNWSNMLNVHDIDTIPRKRYAEIIKGRENYDEEMEKAEERVVSKPQVFSCAYCEGRYEDLGELKQHVVGKLGKTSGRNTYWRIPCVIRKEVEGLKKYKYDLIPQKYKHPQKKIWANIDLQLARAANPDGSFTIAQDIKDAWFKHFEVTLDETTTN